MSTHWARPRRNPQDPVTGFLVEVVTIPVEKIPQEFATSECGRIAVIQVIWIIHDFWKNVELLLPKQSANIDDLHFETMPEQGRQIHSTDVVRNKLHAVTAPSGAWTRR